MAQFLRDLIGFLNSKTAVTPKELQNYFNTTSVRVDLRVLWRKEEAREKDQSSVYSYPEWYQLSVYLFPLSLTEKRFVSNRNDTLWLWVILTDKWYWPVIYIIANESYDVAVIRSTREGARNESWSASNAIRSNGARKVKMYSNPIGVSNREKKVSLAYRFVLFWLDNQIARS